MSTPAIYAFICDRFGPDTQFMWKLDHPDAADVSPEIDLAAGVITERFSSIECWMITSDADHRMVLIGDVQYGGSGGKRDFIVFAEIKIRDVDRLAMAVKELGEFESAYRKGSI